MLILGYLDTFDKEFDPSQKTQVLTGNQHFLALWLNTASPNPGYYIHPGSVHNWVAYMAAQIARCHSAGASFSEQRLMHCLWLRGHRSIPIILGRYQDETDWHPDFSIAFQPLWPVTETVPHQGRRGLRD